MYTEYTEFETFWFLCICLFQIHVFGYGADKDGNWYHYWESLTDKNLKTGIHPGTHEYNMMNQLAAQQKLKFFNGAGPARAVCDHVLH